MPKGDKLTVKQQLFIREYLVDNNWGKAAIRAWYSKSGADVTASNLLRNTKIKQAIDKQLEKNYNKVDISAERVLNNIKELAEKCLQIKTVKRLNKDTGEYEEVYAPLDASGANTALANLGKYHKLFTEKHELTGKDGWPIEVVDFSNMTAKQIQEHLKSLM